MGNPYFDHHNPVEQDLIEDLIDESINIYSETFYYVPRTISSVADINIFNEDRNSLFKHAYPFSGYLENASSGFEGNGYLMQKFGGIADLSATITISRREWEKNIGAHGTTIIPDSPCTGDLIYWPTTDQLFEIKFVDEKSGQYAQLGRYYTFKLTIELMQYSSQHIDTGIPEIDMFESLKTFDVDPDTNLWGGLVEVQIENPGKGYTHPPEIIIDSLTGNGAVALVTLNEEGGIEAIAVEDHGQGYHSTDVAHVIGNCEQRAVVTPIFRTIIENAGDGWGANEAFIKEHQENSPDNWDPQNPFGTIECEDINSYRRQ